jgi:hypothetical protein
LSEGGTLPAGREPLLQSYRPLTRRRRLLIVALAVAMAVAVVTTLLDPPGAPPRTRAKPAPTPDCREGERERTGCVGGRAEVIVPAASAPAAASPLAASVPAR